MPVQTRKEFLRTSAMLTAGALLFRSFKPSKDIGVQLYTFRSAMLEDATGTLKKIASLGIKQLESAGSSKGYYYGLSPKEIRTVCGDLGMHLRSGHIGLDQHWQKTLDDAAEAGQEYLICSSMPSNGQTIDNYQRVAEQFNKAGEEAKKRNIRFGYHNHDYEFETVNGKVLYDVLLDHTDPSLVYMELDLGWVIASGKDPLDYFSRYKGRFPLWHLKDMDLVKKHSTEFGKGSLPIAAILKKAKESGLQYFFVEQEEYTSSPFESMKENVAYLKKMKW
jgi:sugar phosphate isomerase/epimerase